MKTIADPDAYLGGVVAIDSTCRCGADADTVIHSEILGEWDVCRRCGERAIARLHGKPSELENS